MRYTTRIIVPPRVKRSGLPGSGGVYKPQVLGVRKSFGFDDAFGLATPGHLGAAAMHPEFAPVFIQHDFSEPENLVRTPVETMASAVRAVGSARFRQPWGADANHLRTPQEVEDAAAAGFSYYTLDPTDFLRPQVDHLDMAEVLSALDALIEEGTMNEDWCQPYLDRTVELPGHPALTLTLAPLQRAAVKFGRAIRHCARLSEAVARANYGRPHETEAFFGALSANASPLEHLFIGLELEARGVRLTSLALTLVGRDDVATIQQGAAGEVENRLRQHAAVAEFCGPYKLSFHHVSLLPSLYPVLGFCCGDALHVKSRHLSYLEAMRVINRTDPALFEQVAQATLLSFDASPGGSRERFTRAVTGDPERDWLDESEAEQFLATCASSLAEAMNGSGQPLKLVVAETLEQHADVYREQLTALFDKRLSMLKAG